jgi:hypothetical protein
MLTLRSSYALAGAALLVACSGTAIGNTIPDDGTGSEPGGKKVVSSSPVPSATGTATPTPSATATAATPPTSMPTTPPSNPPPPAQCNVVTNDAAVIGAQMVASVAPASTGGAISNGKYHLTDITVYTGLGGSVGSLPLSIAETIHIHGSAVDVIANANGKDTRTSSVITIAGDVATFSQTCPNPTSPSIAHYSVVGTSLVMFMVNDAGQTVMYTYSP